MDRPRTFNHLPIYIDERKERLADVERRVRQQLGQRADHPDGRRTGSLHGAFTRSGQRRRRRSVWVQMLPMVLVLIILFIVILAIML